MQASNDLVNKVMQVTHRAGTKLDSAKLAFKGTEIKHLGLADHV